MTMTMNEDKRDDGSTIIKIAIVYPGNAEDRANATSENNRFAQLFAEFANSNNHHPHNVLAVPAVYHPEFADDVRRQLLGVDAALVFVNPIQDGHDRSQVLDGMLRDISDAGGVYVSAHPDVISALGTKDVLVRTGGMSWGLGDDTVSYDTIDEMRAGLTPKLARGEFRVLKRNRGQSGSGVWLVRRDADDDGASSSSSSSSMAMRVRVRHAERGLVEETMPLECFFGALRTEHRCLGPGDDDGRVIDMAYQERLHEGTIRAYMVHDVVGGFGHQAINALHPTAEVQKGVHPRRYYPADGNDGDLGDDGDDAPPVDFQPLHRKLEDEWLPQLLNILEITSDDLPVLWDADFMLGPKDADGNDTYVLCEINASSVSPHPNSATPLVARAAIRRALITRGKRR
jgi:hypothetical protein